MFISHYWYYLLGIVHHPHSTEFRQLRNLFISTLKQFGFGRQQIMEKRIIVEAESLLEDLRETRSKPTNPEQVLLLCSLRVMASILFGRHYSRNDAVLEDLLGTMRAMSSSLVPELDTCPLRFLPIYRRKINVFMDHNQKLVDFVEKSIEESLDGLSDDSFSTSFVKVNLLVKDNRMHSNFLPKFSYKLHGCPTI